MKLLIDPQNKMNLQKNSSIGQNMALSFNLSYFSPLQINSFHHAMKQKK